jgi:hypothetical protein
MWRLRATTFATSMDIPLVVIPNAPACETVWAIPALQISFCSAGSGYSGWNRQSTDVRRLPSAGLNAPGQARYLPPAPLPTITSSYRSGFGKESSRS